MANENNNNNLKINITNDIKVAEQQLAAKTKQSSPDAVTKNDLNKITVGLKPDFVDQLNKSKILTDISSKIEKISEKTEKVAETQDEIKKLNQTLADLQKLLSDKFTKDERSQSTAHKDLVDTIVKNDFFKGIKEKLDDINTYISKSYLERTNNSSGLSSTSTTPTNNTSASTSTGDLTALNANIESIKNSLDMFVQSFKPEDLLKASSLTDVFNNLKVDVDLTPISDLLTQYFEANNNEAETLTQLNNISMILDKLNDAVTENNSNIVESLNGFYDRLNESLNKEPENTSAEVNTHVINIKNNLDTSITAKLQQDNAEVEVQNPFGEYKIEAPEEKSEKIFNDDMINNLISELKTSMDHLTEVTDNTKNSIFDKFNENNEATETFENPVPAENKTVQINVSTSINGDVLKPSTAVTEEAEPFEVNTENSENEDEDSFFFNIKKEKSAEPEENESQPSPWYKISSEESEKVEEEGENSDEQFGEIIGILSSIETDTHGINDYLNSPEEEVEVEQETLSIEPNSEETLEEGEYEESDELIKIFDDFKTIFEDSLSAENEGEMTETIVVPVEIEKNNVIDEFLDRFDELFTDEEESPVEVKQETISGSVTPTTAGEQSTKESKDINNQPSIKPETNTTGEGTETLAETTNEASLDVEQKTFNENGANKQANVKLSSYAQHYDNILKSRDMILEKQNELIDFINVDNEEIAQNFQENELPEEEMASIEDREYMSQLFYNEEFKNLCNSNDQENLVKAINLINEEITRLSGLAESGEYVEYIPIINKNIQSLMNILHIVEKKLGNVQKYDELQEADAILLKTERVYTDILEKKSETTDGSLDISKLDNLSDEEVKKLDIEKSNMALENVGDIVTDTESKNVIDETIKSGEDALKNKENKAAQSAKKSDKFTKQTKNKLFDTDNLFESMGLKGGKDFFNMDNLLKEFKLDDFNFSDIMEEMGFGDTDAAKQIKGLEGSENTENVEQTDTTPTSPEAKTAENVENNTDVNKPNDKKVDEKNKATQTTEKQQPKKTSISSMLDPATSQMTNMMDDFFGNKKDGDKKTEGGGDTGNASQQPKKTSISSMLDSATSQMTNMMDDFFGNKRDVEKIGGENTTENNFFNNMVKDFTGAFSPKSQSTEATNNNVSNVVNNSTVVGAAGNNNADLVDVLNNNFAKIIDAISKEKVVAGVPIPQPKPSKQYVGTHPNSTNPNYK